MHDVPRDLLDRVLDDMPGQVHDALEQGATLLVSVSGGADSDATAYILSQLRQERRWPGPAHLAHAHLGRIEWPQTLPHVRSLAERLNLPLHVVSRAKGDLIARWWERFYTLQAQGRDRPIPWSSPTNRFCTSDTKTAVLDKLTRSLLTEGTIVSADGIRAEESAKRRKDPILEVRQKVTTRARLVWNLHPILHLTKNDVWRAVGSSAEVLAKLRAQVSQMRLTHSPEEILAWVQTTGWPAHPAYSCSTRLSCACCIMASRRDLLGGIEHNVETYRDLVDLEIASHSSFQHAVWLHKLRPDLLRPDQRQALGYANDGKHLPPAQQISLF